jgi:hypothetical protein
MATIEGEVVALKERVERLEAIVNRLVGEAPQDTVSDPGKAPDQEQLLLWLKTQGFIREPTSEERRLAAEWDALPEEEKQAHIHFMHSLVLDPPLSQIIIEQRR